jgi:hypothetical protein
MTLGRSALPVRPQQGPAAETQATKPTHEVLAAEA